MIDLTKADLQVSIAFQVKRFAFVRELTLSSGSLRRRVIRRIIRLPHASRWLSDCRDRKYSRESRQTLATEQQYMYIDENEKPCL